MTARQRRRLVQQAEADAALKAGIYCLCVQRCPLICTRHPRLREIRLPGNGVLCNTTLGGLDRFERGDGRCCCRSTRRANSGPPSTRATAAQSHHGRRGVAGFKRRATPRIDGRSRYRADQVTCTPLHRQLRPPAARAAQEKQEEKVGESASQVSIAGISAARFEYVLNVKHEIDTWLSVCRDPHLDSTNV
jgi:hypothetical protein